MKMMLLVLLKALAAVVAVPLVMLVLIPLGSLTVGFIVFLEEIANDYGAMWRTIRGKPPEHKRVMWVPIGTVGEVYWYLANRDRVCEAFPEAREHTGAKR